MTLRDENNHKYDSKNANRDMASSSSILKQGVLKFRLGTGHSTPPKTGDLSAPNINSSRGVGLIPYLPPAVLCQERTYMHFTQIQLCLGLQEGDFTSIRLNDLMLLSFIVCTHVCCSLILIVGLGKGWSMNSIT